MKMRSEVMTSIARNELRSYKLHRASPPSALLAAAEEAGRREPAVIMKDAPKTCDVRIFDGYC
jgi:hypothetical protein